MVFAVVVFKDDCSVDVVPQRWLENDICLWPPYRGVRLTSAVRKAEEPRMSWTRYSIRILHEFDTYNEARAKLCCAEETSALDTDTEDMERSRKKRKKIIGSDDEDEVVSNAATEVIPQTDSGPDVPQLPVENQNSNAIQSTPQPCSSRTGLPPAPPITPPPPPISTVSDRSGVTPELPVSPSHTHRMSRAAETTVSAFERKMLTLLEEIKQQGQTMILLQQQHMNSQAGGDFRLPATLHGQLPASTVEQLMLINAEANEQDTRYRLSTYLGQAGGGTCAETVRAILKRLMTSDVAKKVNWKGKGEKHSFASLALNPVVCDAVRRNPLTCRATDADVATVIKEWLKHARDRDGGRAQRQRAQTNARPDG